MTEPEDTHGLARTLGVLAAWRSRHGLTAHQAEVLVQVHASGAITAAEVCRIIGITTASMTRIVAHLEDGDWLLRVRDDTDARRLILQPTKQMAFAIEELERELRAAEGASSDAIERGRTDGSVDAQDAC